MAACSTKINIARFDGAGAQLSEFNGGEPLSIGQPDSSDCPTPDVDPDYVATQLTLVGDRLVVSGYSQLSGTRKAIALTLDAATGGVRSLNLLGEPYAEFRGAAGDGSGNWILTGTVVEPGHSAGAFLTTRWIETLAPDTLFQDDFE